MAGVRVLVVAVVVPTLFVGLIARVSAALFIRMLSVLTMHVAGFKTLVLARRETLLLTPIVGASLASGTLTIFASMTSVDALHTVQPVGPALLQKMVELAIVVLLKLMAHLAFCIGLNFVELTARNKAFAQARLVDRLKVLREQLERLFTKFTTGANVLRPVSLVEGHVCVCVC